MTPAEYAPLDRRNLEIIAATGICPPFEKEYFRKDGSRVPVLIGAASLEDSPDEGVCFVLDLTERKEAERARRETEERFSMAFHSSSVGLVISSLTGKFVEVNPAFCELVGYTRDELIGRTSVELGLLSAEDREKLVAGLQRSGGAVRNAEVQFRLKDGQLRDILYSVSPVQLNGVPHRLATGIDVTERNRAEASLAAERDRTQMLARRLLDVQESERRQIARDLHDELGQILTALKINLQTLQPSPFRTLDPSVALVDRALSQTRSLSLSLHPPLLDDLGLVPALRWLVGQHSQQLGPRVTLYAEMPNDRLGRELETACFRLAQEAVTNAIRHASASMIKIELQITGAELLLTVHNDGAGFDHAASRVRALLGGSLGILGMEERATLVGGRVEWASAPGAGGTRVRAWFPLSSRAAPAEGGAFP